MMEASWTADERANVQRVQQLFAAFGRGDLAGVLGALADDVEWSLGGPADLPFAGLRRGREAVVQFFAIFSQTVDVLAFEPKEFLAQDDTIVVLGTERLRFKATGREAENPWVMVFRFRAGRVVNYREHDDTAALVAAARRA